MGKAIEFFGLTHEARMEAGSVGEILLYSRIVQRKWDAEDPDMTALDFEQALKSLKDARRLNIRMNCPGGLVHQAVAMRAMLANHPAQEKHIYIEGLCASAATLIACLPGCVVHMAEGSEYMIHNPRDIAMGDANTIEKTVMSLRNMEKDCYAMYARRTGQEEATIKRWMDETKWFRAQEAVEAGFADEVLEQVGGVTAHMELPEGDLRLMRELYAVVPEGVTARMESTQEAQSAEEVGGGAPPPTAHTTEMGEETDDMDLTNMTLEELQAARPDLFETARSAAMEAERERQREIDDLTPPGAEYAQMAADAKAKGETAMDYHKRILKAQKEKNAAFLTSRTAELGDAAQVPGTASEMDGGGEQGMDAVMREVAEFAAEYRASGTGGMF